MQGDVALLRVQGLSPDVSGNHLLTGGVAGTMGERLGGWSQTQ